MLRFVISPGLMRRMLRFVLVPGLGRFRPAFIPGLGRFESVIVVFVIHAGQYIGRR